MQPSVAPAPALPRNVRLSRRVRRRAQQGVTIVVTLILLVVMLMGGLALARLTEVSTLAAGNAAYHEAAVQASEIGVNTAFAAVQALANEDTNQGNWYFAQTLATDADGLPAIAVVNAGSPVLEQESAGPGEQQTAAASVRPGQRPPVSHHRAGDRSQGHADLGAVAGDPRVSLGGNMNPFRTTVGVRPQSPSWGSLPWAKLATSLIALGALLGTAAQASTSIAELPLKASVLAKPNSGVLNFNAPGDATTRWRKMVYLFPNGTGTGRRAYNDATNDHFAIPPTAQFAFLRSPDFNPLYFNPEVTSRAPLRTARPRQPGPIRTSAPRRTT